MKITNYFKNGFSWSTSPIDVFRPKRSPIGKKNYEKMFNELNEKYIAKKVEVEKLKRTVNNLEKTQSSAIQMCSIDGGKTAMDFDALFDAYGKLEKAHEALSVRNDELLAKANKKGKKKSSKDSGEITRKQVRSLKRTKRRTIKMGISVVHMSNKIGSLVTRERDTSKAGDAYEYFYKTGDAKILLAKVDCYGHFPKPEDVMFVNKSLPETFTEIKRESKQNCKTARRAEKVEARAAEIEELKKWV